jgi:superfamily II DNA or RNA helicase
MRLAELFTAAELRLLISARLLSALRSYKRHELGRDLAPTKAEAAAALVIEYGSELFRNKEVRQGVARKLKIPHVERWHAGHQAAAAFTESAGFPASFAGEMNDERPPVLRVLAEKRRYPALEGFQQNAKTRLLSVARERAKRVLLQLPTGAGKTRIAVDTLREFLTANFKDSATRGFYVIWCAHQDELCDQAATTIEEAWVNAEEACPLNLVRFFGTAVDEDLDRAAEEEGLELPTILVTTPAKALKLLTDNGAGHALTERLREQTRLLVVDEAHRAAAPTYKSILSALTARASIIGLTATPYGKVYLSDSSTDELLALFHKTVIRPETLFEDFLVSDATNAKQFLLEKRILARPRVFQVKTGLRINDESIVAPADVGELETEAERVDEALKRDVALSQSRTQSIFRSLQEVFRQEQVSVLYFAPTVSDALTMTFLLRTAGVPAECVHSGTPIGLRQTYIRRFKEGKIRVLCNVEILTTGFDAPRVTHVVVARPTVSRVLYEQIVGRGLRGPKFGGTEECVVIDCVDSFPSTKLKFGYEYFREEWGIDEVHEFAALRPSAAPAG